MLPILVACVLSASDAGVVDDVEALEALDQQLMSEPLVLASASGVAQKSTESPGVVTVVTREEIANLGARNLIDVLRFVPGFDFSNDIQNSIGLSVRGLWALEGKVLFLLDGQPLNDLAYGNMVFGNRDAIALIERIEIIRGPGSAIYGGFAELAVINVITHTDQPDLVRGAISTGFWENLSRFTGAFAVSKKLGGDVLVRASGFSGQAYLSDQSYLQGTVFNLRETAGQRPLTFSAGIEWKGLKANVLYDDFALNTQLGENPVAPVTVHHRNLNASVRYDLPVTSAFQLSAFASYVRQNPWQANDSIVKTPEAQFYYFDKPIDRVRAGVSAQGTPLQNATQTIRLIGGFSFARDSSSVAAGTPADIAATNTYYDPNGDPVSSLNFFSLAGYAEGTWLNPIVNVTAGARFDWQNVYGGAFVPRIALTREFGGFHAKALLGRAFRGPTFENLSVNPTIKPETATVIELEAGYQWRNWLYVGVNAFDNRIYDAIVYQQDAVNQIYLNAGQTGTRGLEAQVRARGPWGYANLAYSFYAAVGDTVTTSLVDGRPELHLGVPAHKFTLHASFSLTEHFSINPALVVFSERFGLEATLDDPATPVLRRFGPNVLGSVFLVYRNLGVEGLDVSLGMHDIFGANYKFVSAYNSGVNALPQMGREVVVTVALRHDLLAK